MNLPPLITIKTFGERTRKQRIKQLRNVSDAVKTIADDERDRCVRLYRHHLRVLKQVSKK